MSITFPVSVVARTTNPLRMPRPGESPRLHGRPVEAMGASAPSFVPARGHGLLHAVHAAYALHYPLVLSPDAVWLAVAQGFALHVNAFAEWLRGKFVRHHGQLTIAVTRDDFVKGSPANPWPEALGALSDAVALHIGRQRDLVVCDFTTTGPCERAASEIVLLDALQQYFAYEVYTRCGIPEITLDGTADDWRAIRRRARALEEYDLAWWTGPLGEVLDRLVETAEGRVDTGFWRAFFKHEDGSGGPWVKGWINVLFPYLRQGRKLVRNASIHEWKRPMDVGGTARREMASGLACAPFVWDCLGERLAMEFLGGFVGIAQDTATLALRPAIGWAIRNASAAAAAEEDDTQEAQAVRRLARDPGIFAGRMTNPMPLTWQEAAALCTRVEDIGRASGIPLVCAPAGDLQHVEKFPELCVSFRFVVGLRVKDLHESALRKRDIADLRAALDGAHGIPEATWRAVSGALATELAEPTRLYLAVVASRESATLHFGDRRTHTQVAVASSTGRAVVEVDASAEAHAARLRRVLDLGVREEHATYLIEMGPLHE